MAKADSKSASIADSTSQVQGGRERLLTALQQFMMIYVNR